MGGGGRGGREIHTLILPHPTVLPNYPTPMTNCANWLDTHRHTPSKPQLATTVAVISSCSRQRERKREGEREKGHDTVVEAFSPPLG